MNTTRSRWAAIGAAVAVTLGAGGIGITHATTDSSDGPVAAFFPIEPCRLAENIAIGEDVSITLDGSGVTGDCDLPADITGLAANVTAVNASRQTNLRFYAQGDAIPATANLNPTPGGAPAPNAVNIPLNASNGQFSVCNRFGTVGVFIDIMGYYDDHTHDDRYYTKEETRDVAAAAVELTDGVFFNQFDFVVERAFSSLDETVTTDRDGYLLVTKYLDGRATCSPNNSGGRAYFITVDGVAVRSSAVYSGNDAFRQMRLVGVTEQRVSAGEHEIGVAAECVLANDANAVSLVGVSNAAVVVLPAEDPPTFPAMTLPP